MMWMRSLSWSVDCLFGAQTYPVWNIKPAMISPCGHIQMLNTVNHLTLRPEGFHPRERCWECEKAMTKGTMIAIQVEEVFKFYHDRGYWCANTSCRQNRELQRIIWEKF